MGMIGFLDSPFMSMLLSFFLLMHMPGIMFFIICLPFMIDSGISLLNVHNKMNRTSEITEEEEAEEDYV